MILLILYDLIILYYDMHKILILGVDGGFF